MVLGELVEMLLVPVTPVPLALVLALELVMPLALELVPDRLLQISLSLYHSG